MVDLCMVTSLLYWLCVDNPVSPQHRTKTADAYMLHALDFKAVLHYLLFYIVQ